jgi:dolichol-phosphate mannosyltransferase
MLNRKIIEGIRLNPAGYKVLLEILSKGKNNSIIEVPYTFRPRKRGRSKLNPNVIWSYIVHLYTLLRG